MIDNADADPATPVERFYHDLILSAPDAMLAIDAGARRVVLANAAATALLGYAGDELARLGPEDILDPADLERLPAIRRQLDETGTWRGAWRLRHQDGTTIVVEASVSRLLLGKQVIYQALLRDLRAWQETTLRLRQCESQLAEAQRRADEERERLLQALLERQGHLREMLEQVLLCQGEQRRKEPGSARLGSLSPHEREIMRLVAAGSTNQQTGRTLGLSAGTVRNKISRLLPKLDAVDRTQAAARAVEWGLLD
jgi:PAS domain S-box-containing protein